MEPECGNDNNDDIEVQTILLAASQHDVEGLRALLRSGSASVQDPESGSTPLHLALSACDIGTKIGFLLNQILFLALMHMLFPTVQLPQTVISMLQLRP